MNLEKTVPVISSRLTAARNLFVGLIACGLIAACDDTDAVDPAAGAETGEESPIAEVLEGSASDAMIEMDELRSQPPLGAGEEDGPEDGESEENSAE